MGVVLAIDPGRRQGKTLDRLTQEFHEHEVVIATSGDEALVVLDGVVPDLVVFPLFMAPADESKLQGRLRDLSNPADRQALTIPLRAFFEWEAHATRPAAVPPRWFYWFRPVAAAAETATPRLFADAVRADINRPRLEGPPATVASTPVPFPPLTAPTVQIASPVLAASQPPVSVPPASTPALSPALANALAQPPVERAVVPPVAAPPSVPPVPVPVFTAAAPVLPPDVPMAAEPVKPAPVFAPTFGSTFGAGDAGESGPESVEVEVEVGEPRPSVFARIGPLFAGAWQVVVDLPRAVQVGVPVVAILLTLGVTGHMQPLLSAPARLLGSAKNRLFTETPKTGIAEIQTVPDGAQVWYEGRQLGVTPLRSEFAAGTHEVELRYRNTTRTVMLEVTPGATIVQRIEWTAPKIVGKLRVESDPPGAAVIIDGKPRGNTPLTIDDIANGKHAVDVMLSGNTVHENVEIKGTKLVTLRTSIYQGWLALFSPIDVKAAVDGRPVSLDDQGRVMLPSGSHQLTLQNRSLGYNETRAIDIRPGDTTPVNIVLPKTTLTVTTSSPAEVWIDGEKVGDAPITDLPVDIGTRDVLVRSAEHGERHATIVATMNPARVAIDFTASAP